MKITAVAIGSFGDVKPFVELGKEIKQRGHNFKVAAFPRFQSYYETRCIMRAKQNLSFLSGMLGCLCYGGGDWLMMYGSTAHSGAVSWLTAGTASIPGWRYDLAMVLAFPGIILYGIALFSVQSYIKNEKERKIYHYLNAFGLTPWIALHLFYIMILMLFSWMNGNGYAAQALPVCEGLYSQLSWLIPVTEGMMLPVFIYWFYLQIRGKTVFPKWMAFTNEAK